jgi:hypothetical protein
MSSGKKKGLCLDVVPSENDRTVVVHGGDRCCNKHPEKVHFKLRVEAPLRGVKCGGQYKRELIHLVRELAFLVIR